MSNQARKGVQKNTKLLEKKKNNLNVAFMPQHVIRSNNIIEFNDTSGS